MKALRRSIKGEKHDTKFAHISITPKSAIAIIPPKLIIKANYDYEAQGPTELSFKKGDFFHVLSREDSDDWYEACNPTKAELRGLVPAQYFSRIGKNERGRDSGKTVSPVDAMAPIQEPTHDSGYSDVAANADIASTGIKSNVARLSNSQGKRTMGSVLARLEHAFEADNSRPEHDEISRDVGDMVLIVAVSTPEWVVAKPAGPKGGGHGLLPLGFVTLLDMRTHTPIVGDPIDIIRREMVPPVDVWKQATAAYKNSCIELGKIGAATPSQPVDLRQGMDRLSLAGPNGQQTGMREAENVRPNAAQYFRDPAIEESEEREKRFPLRLQMQNYARHFTPASSACIEVSVEEVSYEQDDHVFVLRVQFEDGNQFELYRIYDNFFKFQVLLKDIFPVEAGDTANLPRTLPFMPGPVNPGELTEAISIKRRDNLNQYVHELLLQPVHISRSLLVTTFFSPQNGYDRLLANIPLQEMTQSRQPHYERESYMNPAEAGLITHQSAHDNSNGGYNGYTSPPMQQTYGHSSTGSANGLAQDSYATLPASHMSQDSQKPGVTQPPLAALKVKVCYGDDLFAIRVPNDIMYEDLYDKVCERLKIPIDQDIQIHYKSDKLAEQKPLNSNAALDDAQGSSEKLMIYVTLK